jgi:predicted nucleic-acid-binding Zn-ribbon protein
MTSLPKSCRNCGGTEFYSREVAADGGTGQDLLPIGGMFPGTHKFVLRVCGSCGLADWFVPERFLDGVRKKFERDK